MSDEILNDRIYSLTGEQIVMLIAAVKEFMLDVSIGQNGRLHFQLPAIAADGLELALQTRLNACGFSTEEKEA